MRTKQLFAVIATVAFAGGAFAADSATVDVSATVVGVCKYSTNTGSVSFTLDPSVGGPVNGTLSQPAFWCTKGTGYTITDDNGLNESGTTHRMKHATAAEYILTRSSTPRPAPAPARARR
jgi:spore coat protein U-like protein